MRSANSEPTSTSTDSLPESRGRGYAASLAHEYFVTSRTVVIWVEKARARGILSAPPSSGATGGHLLAEHKGNSPTPPGLH